MNWEFAQNGNGAAVPLTGNIEAYAVFEHGQLQTVLSKEQFEAISDGDLPLKEYTGKVTMAYVIANRHQLVQAAVLFYLPLDDKGYVLDGWRLPLQRLADTAGRGPNLGGGRIRLACHSQCAISWHKDALWDPSTSTFVSIKKALTSHGVIKAALDIRQPPVNAQDDADEEDDIASLRRTLRNETMAYRNQLQSLQQEIEKQRLLNERLHRQLESQQSHDTDNRLDLSALRQQNQVLSQRVRELEVLNDRLHTQLNQTSTEDEQAGDEQSLNDSEQLIEQMAQADMLSVVFHPGAGHINLAPAQLLDYLEDPVAYAAHQVSLSKEQYQVWMDHHSKGKCQVCDARISVIGNPRIFDPEVDVYCETHQP